MLFCWLRALPPEALYCFCAVLLSRSQNWIGRGEEGGSGLKWCDHCVCVGVCVCVGLGEYTTITLRSCNYGVCLPPPKTGVSIVTVAVLPHLSHTHPPTTHRHAAHGHAVSEVARRLGKGGQSALVPDVIHLLIRRVLPVRLSNRGCRIVRDAVQRTCREEGGGGRGEEEVPRWRGKRDWWETKRSE